MIRNIGKLSDQEYDLVVIGGGIFGACAAWDAVLRGLKVALIEKDDFCQATSANHFKMIHGGMRYLQHLDIKRVRESSRERSVLLKTAPHLATPLPILMPTYGHGMRGKEILKTGLFLYELMTFDRNKGINDPARQIPRSSFLSKEEMLKEYPGLDKKNLTGGVVFYDGQIYNPPRLVLSYIRAAVEQGLETANYVEAINYIISGNRVQGVVARDTLSGDKFEIRSKIVLNASGPWAHKLNKSILQKYSGQLPSFSRDLVIVVPKKLSEKYAFAHVVKTRDNDAVFDRGGRHIFIVPWRQYSLIGVWHQVFDRNPEEITVKDEELQNFLNEINKIYNKVDLTVNDVSMVNTGLILFGMQKNQNGNLKHSFGKRSMLIDHYREDNLEGLFTLIGVRATVARQDAQDVLDIIQKRLAQKTKSSKTGVTPIYGGNIDNFEEYVRQAESETQFSLNSDLLRSLIHNYGSEYLEVLSYAKGDPSLGEEIDGRGIIKAEVTHAVREEMALKLQDVIFRRTELGTGENPGQEALNICSELMGNELQWGREKISNEVNEVLDIFSRRGPWRVSQ
jgi:glycerol-3-phosphate dehydrogenase